MGGGGVRAMNGWSAASWAWSGDAQGLAERIEPVLAARLPDILAITRRYAEPGAALA